MIGIFDSGVGGLSIYKEVRNLIPDSSYIYISDSKNFPYGEKTEDQIREFSSRISSFLVKKGVNIIIVACNSATVSSIEYLRKEYQIPFIGIVPAIKPATLITKSMKIAVLLTKAASLGKVYHELLETWANGMNVISIQFPELVKIVEENTICEPKSQKILFSKLDKLIKTGIDTLVLGCTHFIFLKEIIKEKYGNTFNILDPSYGVASQTLRIYENINYKDSKPYSTKFYTTGNTEKLRMFIKQWLNEDNDNVINIDI